jgi:hypothetical protein
MFTSTPTMFDSLYIIGPDMEVLFENRLVFPMRPHLDPSTTVKFICISMDSGVNAVT